MLFTLQVSECVSTYTSTKFVRRFLEIFLCQEQNLLHICFNGSTMFFLKLFHHFSALFLLKHKPLMSNKLALWQHSGIIFRNTCFKSCSGHCLFQMRFLVMSMNGVARPPGLE